MATDEELGRALSFIHRACDVLHVAGAALRDREMPSLASALSEQAIMLTDMVGELENRLGGEVSA